MSNNFTSGMAGPQAVEMLNALWDRVTEQIVGNSTTSLTIGTGTQTLTIEASKQFAIGQTARITYNSDINKWMQGTVSAYNPTTGSLSISVDTISSSGTYAAWTVALNGPIGATGPEPTGFQRYQGLATRATTPTAVTDYYYLATETGTYANFSSLVVYNELAALRYNGSAWVKQTLLDFHVPTVGVGKVVTGFIRFGFVDGVPTVKVTPNTTVWVMNTSPGFKSYGAGGEGYQNPHSVISVPAGTFTLTGDTNVTPGMGGLFVSYLGALSMTNGGVNPTGQVCIAWAYDWNDYFKPIFPTNHFANMFSWGAAMSLDLSEGFRAKNFGLLGDNSTDDSQAFYCLFLAFNTLRAQMLGSWTVDQKCTVDIEFDAGTYLISTGFNFSFGGAEFSGAGAGSTKIKSNVAGLVDLQLWDAKDVAFENIAISYYIGAAVLESSHFNNCKFIWDAAYTNGSMYLMAPSALDCEITNCEFDYRGNIYIALNFSGYRHVRLEGNTFNPGGTGYASHAVRFNNPGFAVHSVTVKNNRVLSGTTGIFFGSSRAMPISNVIVEGNELIGQVEESISFDGFGNNAGLCPVICNGLITSASNDAAGRLVIVAAMKWHDGTTPNTSYPVSSLADWTPYYFSLDEGSGREGTLARIVSADSGTDEFTLDVRTPAADINVGGWCGVQSGFFDCVVRNNVIIGSVGNAPNYNYATALSIYLNVFNFMIEGNTISGCANGINLAGGLMLSTYRTLAYNNVVKNNRFLACNERTGDAVVRFESYYGTAKQYGNQFINNVIQGGKVGIYMRHQANLIYENNVVDHVDACDWKYCANTLPTADATQIGRTFMQITDDGSGNPTAINYYVCKLASGTYSWVAV